MITIEGMSKYYRLAGGALHIFEDVTISIPTNRRVAVLGGENSGKSVLIRMLAGLESPSRGSVNRYAALSFPVGLARPLKPQLSCRQNAEYAARLYGADPRTISEFVAAATELGARFEEPVRTLLATDRARLAYALAYAIPFDTYLVDEHTGVGSLSYRTRCEGMLEKRLETAGLVLATRQGRKARELCDCGMVLADNKMTWYDDITDAVTAFAEETQRTQGFSRMSGESAATSF